MKHKSKLRTRFIVALALYCVLALALWFGYYLINYNTVSRIAKENTILAVENLIEQISVEFEQMRLSASIIAGSAFVQDFLEEENKSVLHEKALPVSEIINNTMFHISNADSVITISANGDYYRFLGGLSNDSCEMLYETFYNAGTVYTVIELNGRLYFCHNAPVFNMSGREPQRIGSVIMLTGLNKTRRNIENLNGIEGIDTALILDGEIILSNNPSLENSPASELEALYAVVSTTGIDGTQLSVSAAVPNGALFPGSNTFMIISFVFLALLIFIVAVFFNYLSGFVVQPMFSAKHKMQMSLLSTQMDAHLVNNTLATIQFLSDTGENKKAGEMASGLAILLRHQHRGEKMANAFDEFQMLENYVALMNIRYDGKYQYDYELDDTLSDCLIPGFILQPIAENAIMHGFNNKDNDAKLFVKGTTQNNKVIIEICDNGTGIPPDKLQEIRDNLASHEIDDFPEPGLHGVALHNIQRRIHLQFGSGYGITIAGEYGNGTTVTVK
ncbi:MAG: histidine kinase, partial [Clostridiales bacterium]|nr:histidine kinase [Clostridiales bacterium]